MKDLYNGVSHFTDSYASTVHCGSVLDMADFEYFP